MSQAYQPMQQRQQQQPSPAQQKQQKASAKASAAAATAATTSDQDENKEAPQKKTRKRNRVPISCVICRRRKVKCDKQKPQCSNCIKNNVQHLCHYLEPKWAKPLDSEGPMQSAIEHQLPTLPSLPSSSSIMTVGSANANSLAATTTLSSQQPLPVLPDQHSKQIALPLQQQQPHLQLPQLQLSSSNSLPSIPHPNSDIHNNTALIHQQQQQHNIDNSNANLLSDTNKNNQSNLINRINNSVVVAANQALLLPLENTNNMPHPAVKIENQAELISSLNESANLKKELALLKSQMKNLETENIDLKKKLNTANNNPSSITSTTATATANNSIRGLKNQDAEDVLDSIFNSNILFIAQKGSQYNMPITYQISVFSWMFFVKNDLYLNDLWMKILKLRQHYESYYNSKSGATEKNLISHYRNYDYKLSKMKSSKNSPTLKSQVISTDKTNEHTSKLKKFLEKSLNLEKNGFKLSKANSHEIEVSSPPAPNVSNSYLQNVCPVTGVLGVCPIGNSNPVLASSTTPGCAGHSPTDERQIHLKIENMGDIDNNKKLIHSTTPTASSPLAQSTTTMPIAANPNPNQHSVSLKRKAHPTMKFNKCPVLHPSETALSSPIAISTVNSYTKKMLSSTTPIISQDGFSDDEQLDDTKVCPLMVGDAKALFKEKLSKMNISAIRESYNNSNHNTANNSANNSNNNSNSNTPHKKKSAAPSPAKSKGTPVIPSAPTTPMSEIKPEDTDKLTNFVPIAMKPDSQPPVASRQNSNSLKRQPSDTNTSQTSNKKQKTKSGQTVSVKSLNYNNTKQIISVIEQHLPSKKIVSLLIDRFFDKLYIYMPYVDEHSFKVRVSAILKASNDTTNSQKIKLSSIGSQYCEEFLTVCLLLIIIRLSWLSLPEKSVAGLSQNELLLMKPENFVSFVLVDIVKEVFSNAKIISKPSVIIFQVGLYLKLYSTVSPEDGFDTDDSYTRNASYTFSSSTNNGGATSPVYNPSYPQQQPQGPPSTSSDGGTPGTPSSTSNANDLSGDLTNESPNMNSPNFISMLVQLARTIGLNRDPLNFKNFYPNANDDEITISRLFKKRHLWRKLWYGLLFITIEANLSLGDYKKGLPIEIDLDPTLGSAINHSWDCRLPGGIEQGVLEKSFENGKILQRELCVVQNFRESIVSYRWIFKGMKLLFAVDKPPTTLEVENVVNKLNEIICEKSKYGFGIDLIMGDQEIVNPFRARNSSVWVKKYTKQIKVLRLKVHLIVKNMIFTLNYLLFLNHEQKLSKLLGQKHTVIDKIDKQRAYIERFFEASLLAAIENFKLFVQFMDDSNKVFPNCSTELLIYPFLMILNHRSHEFLISLVLRVQQSSPVIMEILKKNKIDPKELQKRLFTYLETFIERLDILTKSYYYAWVLKRLVKFFYNILTNSQKFFKLNFKRMSISQKAPPQSQAAQSPTTSKKTPTSTSPVVSAKPILSDNSNTASNHNGEKSAFEIAFGTSKLPPVTDFTHDDRREINFNPVISNSDILLDDDNRMNINISNSNNMAMNVILASSTTPNANGLGISQMLTPDNVSMDSSMPPPQTIPHQQQTPQPAPHQLPSQQHPQPLQQSPHQLPSQQHPHPRPQQPHHPNMNGNFAGAATGMVEELANNIFENMTADMKYGISPAGMMPPVMTPTEFQHPHMSNAGFTARMVSRPNSGRWNNGIGEDLNELFDDQFLNDIGGFAMENVDPNGIFGLHRGISNEAVLSPSVHHMNNMNNFDELEGSTSSLVGNMMVNPANELINMNSFTGGKGEIYNSLNEIDFTNVDLNTPVDNMVYGFDLNMQDNIGGNMGAAMRSSDLANNIRGAVGMNGHLKMNGGNIPGRNMNPYNGSRSSSADAQSGSFGQWNFF